MRWNCPHCDTAIQLKVDWNELERVYAQCRLCDGISHLSLKTAQLKVAASEPEIVFTEPVAVAPEVVWVEEHLVANAEESPEEILMNPPPPFRGTAAYAIPPAFLMNQESVVEIPTHFSTIEDELQDDEKEINFIASIRSVKAPRLNLQQAPVLAALLVALVSGGYLYTQIKKILKEPESPRVASVEKSHKR